MEKKELFKIGDVAKMFHVSVGSLRHYEKLGLISPEYIDENTGYRYYSTRQFECLNTIRYLRLLDMPLSQVSQFLKNRDIEKMQELLKQQKETVVQRQAELKTIEKKIENRLGQLEDALSSQLNEVKVINTKDHRIAWIRNNFSISSHLDLETAIRQIEEQQKDTAVFLGKVGVGIAKEQLIKKQYDIYDMVFIILDDEDSYEGNFEVIKGTGCVSVRYCGSHTEAYSYYEKLTKYIEDNHLKITGFSEEITMIDYGMTNDPSKFVTEIRIPVDSR